MIREVRARVGRAEHEAGEQDELREPGDEHHHGCQRGPASDRVVGRPERTDEIEIDRPVAPVGAEQLRPDGGGEEKQDDARDRVVVGVRGEVELIAEVGREPINGSGDEREHERGDDRRRDEQPGEDLGLAPASKAHRGSQAVLVDGEHGSASTLALPLVAAEADIEDLAGRRPTHATSLSAPSVWKSSLNVRRRGASLRSGASAATSASRIRS